MGLVPLVWLVFLHSIRITRGAAWWFLAAAFGISWVADWVAHVAGPWPISPLYLVSQAALIGAVLLPRRDARWFLGLLLFSALAASLVLPLYQPDLFVHTVAWWGITLMVLERPALGRLRTALLVAFGGGWLCWLGYFLAPSGGSWALYQVCRAVGIGLFCWAAWKPAPTLRIA